MGSYNNMVITSVGQALLTSVLGTQGTLTFSKFQTSSYQYSGGTDLSALTSLNSVQQEVTPSSAGVIDANNLYVSSSVDNDSLATGYTAYTLGIFASDGNSEVLFGVSTAVTPDVIPADTGGTPSTYTYRMQLAVSSTDNITIAVETGAYALATDLTDHVNSEVLSANGVHGIKAVENSGKLSLQVNNNGLWEDIVAGSSTPYGICTTAGSTATKDVTVSEFELKQGATVIVTFTNNNSASNPTLNVNNTGAKYIYYYSNNIDSSLIPNNSTYLFVYDGTKYKLVTSPMSIPVYPFADATDAQLQAMLTGYYNGLLSWEQMGWAVGDTRKIHLDAMPSPNGGTWPAQDITISIVDHDHTVLKTSINNKTKSCITVQLREGLNNNASASGTNEQMSISGNKWSNLNIRTFLNSTFLGAMADSFKQMIKPSNNYRHTAPNTADAELVTDTIFLPSYPEITANANTYYTPTSPAEGTLFEYYSTSSNLIKYGNNNGVSNGVASWWWLGSPSNYTNYWELVYESGAPNERPMTNKASLAPAWSM